LLGRLAAALPPARRLGTALLAAWIVASVTTSVRGTILTRRAPGVAARTETANALRDMRAAIAAAPPGADVYLENRPFKSIGQMLLLSPEMFPGWAGLFTICFPANVVDGHRVFFIERNERVLAAAAGGRRTAALLVAERPAS